MNQRTAWIKTTAGATLLGLSAGTAHAAICSLDNVPAATLLVPHFQVALDQCSQGGQTTLISVRNASPDAVVARVNLWSNADRPVTGFPIYLDAFDSVDINLADVLCSGVVPVTDPHFSGETPSNLGNPPVQRPQCPGPGSGQAYEQITITPDFLQTIQAYLTGNQSAQTGLTKGINLGDNVARGFVTIDTVNYCSALLPGDPGYFVDQISHENVLVGEYRLIDPSNNFSQGQRAVAIEAAAAGVFSTDETTFYGRYNNFSALDRREPLPATFFTHVGFDGSAVGAPETSVIAWREGSHATAEFHPGSIPPEFPLGTTGNGEPLFYFDESNEPVLPPPPLPGEPGTQKGVIPWSSQWLSGFSLEELGYGAATSSNMLYLNLLSNADSQFDTGQAWVTSIDSSMGIFSGTGGAFALDNGCTAGKLVAISPNGALAENPKDPRVIFSDHFQN